MDSLPDVVRYSVGTRGGRAGGFGEGGSDFFLADREVVSIRGEVDVSIGRGRGGGEEVI